jgi:hypothetical protein
MSKTFVPNRDAVASHFNEGGKVKIEYSKGNTVLDKFGVGRMFGVNPDSFSLADICKNGFGDKGPLTLSIENA